MRFANVLHLYRVRLRARALQECFALIGIAAGVGLLFASQIASSSLSSSVGQLNSGIVGAATLQLTARAAQGMPEKLVGETRHLAGVRIAAPLLEVSANAVGPKGSDSVELVGADSTLAELKGALVRKVALTPFAGVEAVVLPAPVANTLGVGKFGETIKFQALGQTSEAALYSRLGEKQIGALISSPIAISTLEYVQKASGLNGRVSRILVEPKPGQTAAVQAGLQRISGGRYGVESASYDEQLFAKAAAATNQSTQLFAVISALVGFLFAFNAMLLTVPQRRRLIADLRRDGYTPKAVIAVLMFDAVVLGTIACAIGLVLGNELSIHLFHSNPGYLSSAFAVGSERVVNLQSILISVAGGMGAASVAVLSPFRDIVSRNPLAAIETKEGTGGSTSLLLTLFGLLCLAATLAILLAAPQDAIVGMVTLIAALLSLLAIPLTGMLAFVRRLAPSIVSAVPHIAVMELRAGRSRAIAIAATGAIAVFGSVSIQGAHSDLLNGLYNAASDVNASTDVWVSAAGNSNLLMTSPFTPTEQAKLSALPGVRAVRVYRGGLLDYNDRRIWVIAPPSEASPLVPPTQLVEGNVAQADARLRAGGWAVVSLALAEEHKLKIGQSFTLPTPIPTSFRVAAVSTNIGWAPGAIVMSAGDYAKAWGSSDASAYNVLMAPGVSPEQGVHEIRAALGSGTALAVQTSEEHANTLRAITRQGLERLSQIATLILVAAVMAMAAAMGAMIWQRRPRLAKLKLEGFPHRELWYTIVLESLMLLGVGCFSGAVFGLFGQQLLDRALNIVINYPVVSSVGVIVALSSLALVTASAVLMVAIPGWFAAKVQASLALQD
ncbi:MAG TPA: ABC transporter permease [Solirubrobacteraceae bacterium]|jgi:putative ABC transport system permease protein|nr:ABC transporter permease [Solirubrobacteraceae bacterium]